MSSYLVLKAYETFLYRIIKLYFELFMQNTIELNDMPSIPQLTPMLHRLQNVSK